MRASRAVAIVAWAIAPATALPASAQVLDGVYAGTITCEAVTGTSQRALVGSVKITVGGGVATYERDTRATTDQPPGQFERGTGSVKPTGEINLSGNGRIERTDFTVSYSGKINRGVARLRGAQRWTAARGGSDGAGSRTCTIEAKIAG